MRWFPFLFAAASVVSASILPRGMSTNLPASAFPKFQPVPLEQAKAENERLDGLKNEHSLNKVAVTANANAVTAASTACSQNPNIRFEWKNYSTSDRLAFIASIKCLMGKPPSGKFSPSASRYEDFVRLHQQKMSQVHGNSIFLIWHRYYLWTFEQVLRKECGFNRAFPWWDEPKDSANLAASDMFTNQNYFGHMVAWPNGDPVCIGSGAFSGLTCHIGPGQNNQAHCLSRAWNTDLTKQVSQSYVNTCNARTSFKDMASCIEYGPHAYGHNGMGGVMSDVSASPSDPVFWMHHSFLDHSFRIWQNVAPARAASVNGVDANNKALDLNYVISVGGIMPDVKIGDIMNTLSGATIGGKSFCYRYNY